MIEFEHHDDLTMSVIGSLVEELHTFIGTVPDIIFWNQRKQCTSKKYD